MRSSERLRQSRWLLPVVRRLQASPVKRTPIHPKLYATVISRERVCFSVRTDDGREYQLQVANKSGKGHHDEVQPGVRVKIYQRTGEDFFHYRLVGC